jgi:hypothetical protein
MKTSTVLRGPAQEEALPAHARGSLSRSAYVLSGLIVALIAAVSVAGLFVRGLYPDGAWAREALRGGDLATLVIAAPLLLGALILYNYAYYLFGAEFNDVFLLHIAILSMSIFALALLAPRLDVAGIAARIRGGGPGGSGRSWCWSAWARAACGPS